ncbi:Rpn family recombination-promoting nuclease/putative transposase [bacterium]|nr:Rpn family recombination-promoting nuclease/putative transposase [bacterium]
MTTNKKNLKKNNTETVRKRKTLEELTIQDDYLFKRIMEENDICTGFLEILLGIKIKEIVYIKIEEVMKELYDSKGIRLDVYLKDNNDIVYNIEMQVTSIDEEEFAKRFRYYEAMIDSYLLRLGQDYNKLNKLFIIFICPFKIFDGKKQIYTFKNFCQENKSIELKDDVTKIFISTKGEAEENRNDDFEALLKYIDGIKTENSFVNKIDNRINQIKKDEKERGAYMQYDLHLRQIEKKAKEEGKLETLFEIAKNMILGNMPLDKIAEFTKLPISEIKEISAQMA